MILKCQNCSVCSVIYTCYQCMLVRFLNLLPLWSMVAMKWAVLIIFSCFIGYYQLLANFLDDCYVILIITSLPIHMWYSTTFIYGSATNSSWIQFDHIGPNGLSALFLRRATYIAVAEIAEPWHNYITATFWLLDCSQLLRNDLMLLQFIRVETVLVMTLRTTPHFCSSYNYIRILYMASWKFNCFSIGEPRLSTDMVHRYADQTAL